MLAELIPAANFCPEMRFEKRDVWVLLPTLRPSKGLFCAVDRIISGLDGGASFIWLSLSPSVSSCGEELARDPKMTWGCRPIIESLRVGIELFGGLDVIGDIMRISLGSLGSGSSSGCGRVVGIGAVCCLAATAISRQRGVGFAPELAGNGPLCSLHPLVSSNV